MSRRLAGWCVVALIGLAAPFAHAETIRPMLLDAQQQYADANYEQALKRYQEASEAEAGHPAVEYNIGLCHWRLDDSEKAMTAFEQVSSDSSATTRLRSDSAYNVGLIRARGAREKLLALTAPATKPAEAGPIDSPENLEALEGIADELLRAILAWRKSAELQPDADTEENIRAARILRRDVLGWIRSATEKKQKQEMLEDPRKFLKTLLDQQNMLVSLVRQLILRPPEQRSDRRHASRAALRMQRQLMEQTGMLANELAQFREQQDQSADPTATQPAEETETPQEKVYHGAAEKISEAVTHQRDCCAYLIDDQTNEGWQEAFAALNSLRTALFMFPQELGPALAESLQDQQAAMTLVEQVENEIDFWADARVPVQFEDTETLPDWPMEKTALFDQQMLVLARLSLLQMQCQQVAASSQPAEQPGSAPTQRENPTLDPELNEKVANVLAGALEHREPLVTSIMERNKEPALEHQQAIIDAIQEALELMPLTIPQQIQELIVRQATLNEQVKASVAQAEEDEPGQTGLDLARRWASKLKEALLHRPDATEVRSFRQTQKAIDQQTQQVQEKIREKIPSAGTTQPAPQGSASGAPEGAQAYIEASTHLSDASDAMVEAIGGIEQSLVSKSLKLLHEGAVVQQSQHEALQALIKALMALQPPEQQDQQQQQQQQNQQQQDQKQDQKEEDQQERSEQEQAQDIQRQVEQQERERKEAEQQLRRRTPQTVIKDW